MTRPYNAVKEVRASGPGLAFIYSKVSKNSGTRSPMKSLTTSTGGPPTRAAFAASRNAWFQNTKESKSFSFVSKKGHYPTFLNRINTRLNVEHLEVRFSDVLCVYLLSTYF